MTPSGGEPAPGGVPKGHHPVGVAHGRFQVLHKDHLKYLLAAKSCCNHLVVGITNPDPSLIRTSRSDPQRSELTANPLTYYERYCLVRAALGGAGAPAEAFSIVPMPINVPDLIHHYLPVDAVFFLTIYDAWGEEKRDRLNQLGYATQVLWQVDPTRKGISGTEIRRRMVDGEQWSHLVPAGVDSLLKDWDVPRRLRELARRDSV